MDGAGGSSPGKSPLSSSLAAVKKVKKSAPLPVSIREFSDGTYSGTFLGKFRHGHGSMQYSDGSKYEGAWAQNQRHGSGTLVKPDGTQYTGQYPDGTKFTGVFSEFQPHGSGSWTWADGSQFQGDAMTGTPHGCGIFTSAEGVRELRTFAKGEVVSSVPINAKPSTPKPLPKPPIRRRHSSTISVLQGTKKDPTSRFSERGRPPLPPKPKVPPKPPSAGKDRSSTVMVRDSRATESLMLASKDASPSASTSRRKTQKPYPQRSLSASHLTGKRMSKVSKRQSTLPSSRPSSAVLAASSDGTPLFKARAFVDYSSRKKGHLAFKKGASIAILSMQTEATGEESGWLGMLNGKVGFVPPDHVDRIGIPCAHCEHHVAHFSHCASASANDVIQGVQSLSRQATISANSVPNKRQLRTMVTPCQWERYRATTTDARRFMKPLPRKYDNACVALGLCQDPHLVQQLATQYALNVDHMLMGACARGDAVMTALLLALGGDPNVGALTATHRGDVVCPLQLAATAANKDCLRVLLEGGASIMVGPSKWYLLRSLGQKNRSLAQHVLSLASAEAREDFLLDGGFEGTGEADITVDPSVGMMSPRAVDVSAVEEKIATAPTSPGRDSDDDDEDGDGEGGGVSFSIAEPKEGGNAGKEDAVPHEAGDEVVDKGHDEAEATKSEAHTDAAAAETDKGSGGVSVAESTQEQPQSSSPQSPSQPSKPHSPSTAEAKAVAGGKDETVAGGADASSKADPPKAASPPAVTPIPGSSPPPRRRPPSGVISRSVNSGLTVSASGGGAGLFKSAGSDATISPARRAERRPSLPEVDAQVPLSRPPGRATPRERRATVAGRGVRPANFRRSNTTIGRGIPAKGRGSAIKGRGSAIKGRGSAIKGRGSRIHGRGSPAKGRGVRAKSPGMKSPGPIPKGHDGATSPGPSMKGRGVSAKGPGSIPKGRGVSAKSPGPVKGRGVSAKSPGAGGRGRGVKGRGMKKGSRVGRGRGMGRGRGRGRGAGRGRGLGVADVLNARRQSVCVPALQRLNGMDRTLSMGDLPRQPPLPPKPTRSSSDAELPVRRGSAASIKKPEPPPLPPKVKRRRSGSDPSGAGKGQESTAPASDATDTGVRHLRGEMWANTASREPSGGVQPRCIGQRNEMHDACDEGNEDKLKKLLRKREGMNDADNHGWRPILLAASGQHLRLVKMLASSGANPGVTNDNGNTALHYVARCTDPDNHKLAIDVMRLLVKKGADVNAVNNDGETPVHQAVLRGAERTLQWLLTEGSANVNVSSTTGNVALHYAIHVGNRIVVKCLVDAGANVTVRNNAGVSPLDMARSLAAADLVMFLKASSTYRDAMERDCYRALYTFEAPRDDVLSFAKNDVITFVEWSSEGWFTGLVGNREGLVPLKYTAKIERLKRIVATESYDPPPERDDLLSFVEGDVLDVVDEDCVEGWYRAMFECGRCVGLVPQQYVKEVVEVAPDTQAHFVEVARKQAELQASMDGGVASDTGYESGADSDAADGAAAAALPDLSAMPPLPMWHPKHGFRTESLPAEWELFFRSAGVRKKHLRDPDTARYIVETLRLTMTKFGCSPVGLLPEESCVVESVPQPVANLSRRGSTGTMQSDAASPPPPTTTTTPEETTDTAGKADASPVVAAAPPPLPEKPLKYCSSAQLPPAAEVARTLGHRLSFRDESHSLAAKSGASPFSLLRSVLAGKVSNSPLQSRKLGGGVDHVQLQVDMDDMSKWWNTPDEDDSDVAHEWPSCDSIDEDVTLIDIVSGYSVDRGETGTLTSVQVLADPTAYEWFDSFKVTPFYEKHLKDKPVIHVAVRCSDGQPCVITITDKPSGESKRAYAVYSVIERTPKHQRRFCCMGSSPMKALRKTSSVLSQKGVKFREIRSDDVASVHSTLLTFEKFNIMKTYKYTKMDDFEVMFHVSPLLPNYPDDVQKLERKRHLGNDVVMVIYKEGGDLFTPAMCRSQFNHVWIVVQRLTLDQVPTQVQTASGGNGGGDDGDDMYYRVEVCAKPGVPAFGPPLPSPPIFKAGDAFRSWLMYKMINGERASMHAVDFRGKLLKTNRIYLDQIVKDHGSL